MGRLRQIAAGTAILVLAACKSLDVPVTPIPEGSVQFVFDPSKLFYDFYDSTSNNRLRLIYLNDQPYAGTNCIALVPSAATDTVGEFVFASVGQNIGRLLREDHGFID